MILSAMNMVKFTEKTMARETSPKPAMPVRKTFLLPLTSAILPKGRLRAAMVMIYALITAFTVEAFTEKVLSRSGMERLRAFPMKVVIRAVTITVKSTAGLPFLSFICSTLVFSTSSC